jgi:NAD-dependent SIR2 family protein deacetylase
MKCPHCNNSVGWFKGLKRIKTGDSKAKILACPACGEAVQRHFNWKLFFVLMPVMAILLLFVVRPTVEATGLSYLIGVDSGLMGALAMLPCYYLKEAVAA